MWVRGNDPMRNNLFFPLVVVVVGALITFLFGYYLKTEPDVRYTLSEPIPVSFLNPEGNPEIIQLLEVKNLGSAKAERIQIKISGRIADQRIEQFSQDDKPVIHNQGNSFEIVYPELPPQGNFKVILKAQGSEVNAGNLRIIDNSGSVRPALAKGNESNLLLLGATLISVVSYGILAFLTARTGMRRSEETSLQSKSALQILVAKKPWHIGIDDWSRIVARSLRYRIARDGGPILESETFHILSTDKPETLDADTWSKIIETASSRFTEIASRDLFLANSAEIEKFLEIRKPKNLQESAWENTLQRADFRFRDAAMMDFYRGEAKEAFLKRGKPEQVSTEAWTDVRKRLQEMMAAEFGYESLKDEKPYDFLLECDLLLLEPEQRTKLLSNAHEIQYRTYSMVTADAAKAFLDAPRPDWLADWKVRELESRAKKIIELETEKEQLLKQEKESLASVRLREEDLTRQKSNMSEVTDKLLDEYRSLVKRMDSLTTDLAK